MLNGNSAVPVPVNEPVLDHVSGSTERAELEAALADQMRERVEVPMTIGGRSRRGGGESIELRAPHDRAHVLGTLGAATHDDARAAVAAAKAAAPEWADLPFDERAAVMLRAADMLSTTWRARMNAATMLGQSKTVQQSEIDAVAELADFWRFNVHFAEQLRSQQPISPRGQWNRMDMRPLDGFVYAVTPFNFTSIAGNLPTAPALMGNTVVWKPAVTQSLAAEVTMRLLEAAGMPPGVINLVTGHGAPVSDVVLADRELGGIHFTGSTATFRSLWSRVGRSIADYRAYPRLVGETGGKGFIVAHPSADPARLKTAVIRGAFEYQGQKCSAASRLYVPRSIWVGLRDELADEVRGLAQGSPLDFGSFMTAVIDERAFAKVTGAIERAKANPNATVVVGGGHDDRVGWFIEPTVIESTDPADELFSTEFFGPLLGVHVYDDADFDRVLDLVDEASPYALTGAVFATDRSVIERASHRLRATAGNLYINDRPTGAVVGQQPFGGSRASGTNDKAGSMFNLVRWTSPRVVKETFNGPTDHRYPSMG